MRKRLAKGTTVGSLARRGPNEIGAITGVDNAVLGALPDKHQFQFTTRGEDLYAASQQVIVTVDSARRVRWKKPRNGSRSLIIAHDLLLAGGDGEVTAYRATDGELIWRAEIKGSALGLAVAQGHLLVSSDLGHVYCFGPQKRAPNAATTRADGPEAGGAAAPVEAKQQRLVDELAKLGHATAGYALVIDPPDTGLLVAMARQSSLQLIATFRDPKRVVEARGAAQCWADWHTGDCDGAARALERHAGARHESGSRICRSAAGKTEC